MAIRIICSTVIHSVDDNNPYEITMSPRITDRLSKDLGNYTTQTAKIILMFFSNIVIFICMEKELVYLFLYNPMICTSSWTTQSVHKTRKSAELAMEAHKAEAQAKWEQDFITPEERLSHPFGKFEDWRINAMVLEG